MTTFDPDLLPSPSLLNTLRDSQRAGARPPRMGEWYTPMLLFGVPDAPLDVSGGPVMVGRIPIIEACRPVAWYLSSNVAATMTMHLDYADPPSGYPSSQAVPADLQISLSDTPAYTLNVTPLHPPALSATSRAVYEQTPWIAGWPASFDRYGELRVWVDTNDLAEQVLLVLYMLKLRVR